MRWGTHWRMIAVHGPHTWGQPFFAESAEIIVNMLGPLDLEFKSKTTAQTETEDPFDWDFGDGTPLVTNGFEVRHVFADPGTFVVTMTLHTTTGPVTDQVEITLDGNGFRAEVAELEQPKRKPKAA